VNTFKHFFILVLTIIVLNENTLVQNSKNMLASIFEPVQNNMEAVSNNTHSITKSIPTLLTPKKTNTKEKTPKKPSKIDLEKYFAQVAVLDINRSDSTHPADIPNALENLAVKYLGHKYIWGGITPDGFDCSGFTQYLFNKVGYPLPRTALQQSKKGVKVSLHNLKKGDLLYFNTDKSRGIPVSHVGIYLEDGKFIHAANSKKGVIISSFKSYKNTFVIAKRVLQTSSRLVSPPKSIVIPTVKKLNKVNSFMAQYDPFVIYQGRYIRQSQLQQRKNNDKQKTRHNK